MTTYGGFTFNKIQLGRETTPGTAVAATTIWRGPFAMLEDTRQRESAEEQVGILVPAERSYDKSLGAQLTMPSTELTFEQVVHILEAGVGTVTPTGTGPYVYTYTFPTGTSVNTIKTYTIEAGNVLVPTDVQRMEYGFVTEFEFSGEAQGAWEMSATWQGRQLTTSTFTASLALPTVEEALFSKTKLYIDASGGTVGTTQVTGVLMGASVKATTGIQAVPVGDGVLYFAAHKFIRPTIEFSLILELEENAGSSVVATERAAFSNNDVRLFKLDVPGSDANHNFAQEWAGKYDSVGNYEDKDGNTTVQLDGHVVYSSVDSLFWRAIVTNNLATIP